MLLRLDMKRLARSWTIWLGVLVLAWPEISPLIGPILSEWIGDPSADTTMRMIGIAVILARIKTAYQASK